MDEQAEPAQRALSLDAGDEVVGQPDPLARRAEHEFVRVGDERRVADLDELGDGVAGPGEIDVWVVARAEDAEHVVEPDVEARRLDALRVERIYADAAAL